MVANLSDGGALTANAVPAEAGRKSRPRRAAAFGNEAVAAERAARLREAAQAGHVPAMYAFGLTCEDPGCRRSWLRAAADQGHVEAMYALTAELEDFDERKRWLERAAEEGHVAAMYYWGLVCDDPYQRERWLTEAARNGCEAAAAELCDD